MTDGILVFLIILAVWGTSPVWMAWAKKLQYRTCQGKGTPWSQQGGPFPHRCPVCQGSGCLPAGCSPRSPDSTANTSSEVCRACHGDGILWSRQENGHG
jgi:hypothetical protein